MSLDKWLQKEQLTDSNNQQQLNQILSFVDDDNLYLSFVAEYSRGKTELINTLFFSHYGQRVLPSGMGRTTMCPTEILFDPDQALGLRLLPIETLSSGKSLTELRDNPNVWVEFDIDISKPNTVSEPFKQLQEVIKVPRKIAQSLGFNTQNAIPHNSDDSDLMEIPKWRHASINMQHPLLEQNLVILDTPGLNAIGAESDLTINQLPKAHAIVLVLDCTAGVTKSDHELWSQHVQLANNSSRLIALNKIDTIWDSLKEQHEIDAEIQQQATRTASKLGVPLDSVFPISAQAGLVAKIRKRRNLLTKSRITAFETAIAENLIPSKKKIVLTNIFPIAQDIAKNADATLNKRLQALEEQEREASSSHHKNTEVIERIMQNMDADTDLLKQLNQRHDSIEKAFTDHIAELRKLLDPDAFEQEQKKVKQKIRSGKSIENMRLLVLAYFKSVNKCMHLAVLKSSEIETLSNKLQDTVPSTGKTKVNFRRLELDRHLSMLHAVEQSYHNLLKEENLSLKQKISRLNKAFDSCSLAITRTYRRAFNETNDWNKTLLGSLETQVREQKKHIDSRRASIVSIQDSNNELERRLLETEAMKKTTTKQKTQLYALVHLSLIHI